MVLCVSIINNEQGHQSERQEGTWEGLAVRKGHGGWERESDSRRSERRKVSVLKLTVLSPRPVAQFQSQCSGQNLKVFM